MSNRFPPSKKNGGRKPPPAPPFKKGGGKGKAMVCEDCGGKIVGGRCSKCGARY